MSSRYRLASVLAALALALGPACTSTDEGAGRLARRTPQVGWTNAEVHWVTQPRTVGGRFVAYLERDGWLAVAGLDATTGEMAWELPASASGLTSGVTLHLASDDRLVYFGTPVDLDRLGPSVFVIAVDGASGAEVWRTTTTLTLADTLDDCEDDRAAFCVSDERAGPDRALRIAKADGKVTPRSAPASSAPPPIGRGLGSGLYDLGGRDPEVIAAIDPSGRTLWTKTAPELSEDGRSAPTTGGAGNATATSSWVRWAGRTSAAPSTCPSPPSPESTRPRARWSGSRTALISVAASGCSPRSRARSRSGAG